MSIVSSELASGSSQLVSEELRKNSDHLLKLLIQKLSGVKGAVITTGDGFEVAVNVVSDTDGAKLAAMASSISAIGNMAVQETDLGSRHSSITIEGEDGYIFIMDIPNPSCPMILNVITSKSAVLGQVIYYAKHIVNKLSTI